MHDPSDDLDEHDDLGIRPSGQFPKRNWMIVETGESGGQPVGRYSTGVADLPHARVNQCMGSFEELLDHVEFF